jgi:hypothetical protein
MLIPVAPRRESVVVTPLRSLVLFERAPLGLLVPL